MKVKWGTIGIIIALLILAASIFFAGIKVSQTVTSNAELLKEKTKRDAVSLIWAFRKSSVEDRTLTSEDLKAGYDFADSFLGSME
ncbi:hypothetical protein E3J33_02425 [Candidatus Aerophobetes bacterium]|uniref:Uncharacterized protein n=2 Tax=root TaxID=1 RepID=A0A523YNT1_UNCAE|nr:MAG: hypothetical protein E3J33_02425 [Candidatus Aerophobetes bacterium]